MFHQFLVTTFTHNIREQLSDVESPFTILQISEGTVNFQMPYKVGGVRKMFVFLAMSDLTMMHLRVFIGLIVAKWPGIEFDEVSALEDGKISFFTAGVSPFRFS